MAVPKPKTATIADYIAAAPKPAQKNLRELYAILRKAAPKAREAIKWSTPVFEDTRILFAFAAYKSHINFMPTPPTIEHFRDELEDFTVGKGSIQFPHDAPLPKNLIAKIARYRVKDLRDNDTRWM
jgi:uncharacterized protein YdhG (YjbR/CyaY superfamily)